ncbi:proton myo-inositol cotransporter [Patella vulgata]|uniref:proton myo-inositol cotransporter n=1 Tax=Patella vulgata TaxID=6465 RepID=UPI00217F73D7|nr:proton myo-inositol cotransporter [Patella vulgata]XP_050413371.1 proton myo-inositol cotransporter [Patella vulgata]
MASTAKSQMVDEMDGSKTLLIPKKKHSAYVYILTFFAVLGGFLFGYDTGIISGSMLLIRPYFDLDTFWTQLIVSATVGSAAVSALIAGFMSDCLGRKVVIILGSFVFAVGAVVMGVADSQVILLVGRIIVGIGVGFASMTVPVYVAEAAPPDIRGRLVTLNQLFITIGLLAASLVAGGFSSWEDTGWRYMLGLGGVPAIFQFLGMLYLPESPRWLIDQELEATARASLVQIRGTEDVDKELEDIKESVANAKKASLDDSRLVIIRIWTTPHVRRAQIVGAFLQIFQQACGINTIIYYSASILKMGGFSVQQSIWLVAIPYSINFLATFIGLGLVDRVGRRILLLASFIGVFISLGIMATGFQLAAINSPPIHLYENNTDIDTSCNTTDYRSCNDCTTNLDCGYCYSSTMDGSCLPVDNDNEADSMLGRCNNSDTSGSKYIFTYDFCPNDYGWMLVAGMGLFVTSFAPGLGPMPWTVNSEIYPLWARSTGFSVATAVNWSFNLLVSFTFLSLMQLITKYGTFWLYGGFCVIGFIFTLIFVPETKNKTLEEMEDLFKTDEERKLEKSKLGKNKINDKKETGNETGF